MDTCTWAPTVFQGTQVVHKRTASATPPDGFLPNITQLVQRYESLGINNLLVAQRWWGSGKDIEASSLD